MADSPVSSDEAPSRAESGDITIECPKCLYTQTIGELRRTHRCGKCGHSTRSGAQQREARWRDEIAALTAMNAELSASLLDARERVGRLEKAFDAEREARNKSDSMIAFAASNLAHAEAQLTALRERAEKAERELDAEAARIDALAAHLDVNGSATLTVWANEMIEIEGVCVGDDDDDDDDPAMFDSLREALDYLAENSPHADEGDDDTAPAPAGECDD